MRERVVSAAAVVLCTGAAVHAGVPSSLGVPSAEHSTLRLTGSQAPCQFRFRLDGSLDILTLLVTIRDDFDAPWPGCLTSGTLKPLDSSLCSCCPIRQAAVTNANGAVTFVWDKIGGRGSATVCVTTHCQGNLPMGCRPFDLTSPDLDGDCIGTDVIDLGLWAACLPPSSYCKTSDYNCDLAVDVIDLAVWAGGFGVDCNGRAACP
jgi:hypothetical protein